MTILIADDDPLSLRRLQHYLTAWGYDVICAGDGLQAWNLLQANDDLRLAILDWQMPGLDGVEICRKLRTEQPARFIYLMLLTSKSDRRDIAAGIEAGADDYLRKPLDEHELAVRLRVARRIVDFHAELIKQSAHDALTGVWNRKAIFDLLHKELGRAARANAAVSVVMADIDHFKSINDTQGHQGGDRVLRDVARRLAACLRPSDAVGRYGGEEFMIVLPGCDLSEAAGAAERLRREIADSEFGSVCGTLQVTVSLGAASSIGQCFDAEDLVREADAALYRAKRGGRNRVELHVAESACSAE
ncbi:diguanylate cyclase [Planctomicrobium piriforme]|uniref:diguanylate cyclase n=1 Tax=Planctomicrobium piriforme TaxID=1576369 RepID=A0A1I3SRK3_9PLAN|nr:diguanylate cyclase [Planctomicrobium piriforme]SFJ60842.1 diguanylate cyclase (GGDEF) domain-containing protein [Planctomicrobium piriforme]